MPSSVVEGRVNHKRDLRVMREESLFCHLKRQFVPTTDSRHRYQVSPNLEAPMELTAPNQAWVGDITYIRLPSCFVYLACLLDAYSRRCVGWKLSKRIDTELALGALDMALTTRTIQPDLIHHSDRGVQYASTASVERLLSVQAQISMAAVGNPYDNAKAERFAEFDLDTGLVTWVHSNCSSISLILRSLSIAFPTNFMEF